MSKSKTAAPKKAHKTADKVQESKVFTTDGFANFVSRVGNRTENVNANGMYIFDMLTRNRLMLEAMYRGSWIVGRVVDAIADDMTRAGITITTNEGATDVEDLHSEITRLQLWNSLGDLIRWARLYGGAVGVLQIDGADLASPLEVEGVAKGSFKGIAVYDRWQLYPDLTEVIQDGPEMGLPAFYTIVPGAQAVKLGTNPTSAQLSKATGSIKVHYTRVIRQIGIPLPYWQALTEMFWGESVVERLWDRLNSFDTATLSAAQLINRAYLRTVKVENLREILSAGGDAQKALEEMFSLMRNLQTNEGLTLLDKNDEFATTSYSFAGLSDMMLQFGQQIAGASGIPLVILFGQSPAGLNSTGESDIRNYYDNINAQQEGRLRPGIQRLLEVVYKSKFDKPMPKDLQFEFTPLWQMSATDKATVAKTLTESVLGAMDSGVIEKADAMTELRHVSSEIGLFSTISDEAIETARAEPPLPNIETGEGGEGNAPSEQGKNLPNLDSALKKAWDKVKGLVRK